MEKTNFENLTISATYTGSKPAPWCSERNHNHHRIYIRNRDTGATTSFDFWASIARPRIDTEGDLLDALGCWLFDACDGGRTYEDFISDFPRSFADDEIKRTYAQCKRTRAAAIRVLGSEQRIFDLLDKLDDIT